MTSSLDLRHPLLRYHGGKFKLSDFIISYFPNHQTYVEPFGGGASVLLSKSPSPIEVYNDLDDQIVNFFSILRDEFNSTKLANAIRLTPYSRTEFLNAKLETNDLIEKSRRLVVRAQMGFGSAGASRGNTGFRLDTARGGSDIVTIWNRYPEIILQAAARLKNVLVENRPALKVIQDHDRTDTLFYLDPPYVTDTRTLNSDAYSHEMTDSDHVELLKTLNNLKGMCILSGYDHPIYEENLKDWQKIIKQVSASGREGSVIRNEILWINKAAQIQSDLFQ